MLTSPAKLLLLTLLSFSLKVQVIGSGLYSSETGLASKAIRLVAGPSLARLSQPCVPQRIRLCLQAMSNLDAINFSRRL